MNDQTYSQFFSSGGTLPLNAPSYIKRAADDDLFAALLRQEFCYVLTSRQMGKSSLMVRTAVRLRASGVTAAILDLNALGHEEISAEQWYFSLLMDLGERLGVEEELETFWLDTNRPTPIQRWMAAIRHLLTTLFTGPLVIFIDEIDQVRALPFSTDEFFAALRTCYNRRPEDPEFKRLTFCLLGVATPSDLIRDTRMTPFNIGRRIDLTDFRAEEIALLEPGLRRDEIVGSFLLERVYYWTGGHPYLTQRLCEAIAEDSNISTHQQVDQLCDRLFLSSSAREQEDNLLFVRDRLLRSEADIAGLLDCYDQVCGRRPVADDKANSLISILQLSGIVRSVNGYLQARNRIYARVFDRTWIRSHLPDGERRRQQRAYHLGVMRTAGVAAAIVTMVGLLACVAGYEYLNARGNLRQIRQKEVENNRLLSQAQAERGVRLMMDQTPEGLLSLVQAGETAGQASDLREACSRIWAGWIPLYEGRLAQVVGHKGRLNDMALSPDGKLMATASDDGTGRLWDTRTGNPYGPPLKHGRPVNRIAFSPEGKLVATASDDGNAILWSTATGQQFGPALQHDNEVSDVAFSPNGRLVATSSYSGDRGVVTLWDTATGKRHGTPLRYPVGTTVSMVTFSPDGTLIATTRDEVGLWDTRTGKPHAPGLKLKGQALTLAFSPNSRVVATSSYADVPPVNLWDTATGRRIGPELRPMGTTVAFAFSPNGKLLATSTDWGMIWIWNLETGKEIGQPLVHRGSVTSIAFSPDGKMVATGATDGTARLWDTVTGLPLCQPLQHQGSVIRIAFTGNGKALATASEDGMARLWNTTVPTSATLSLWKGVRASLEAVDRTGTLVAAAFKDHVALWDLRGRNPLCRTIPWPGCELLRFSPDSRLLATVSNKKLRVWDVETGNPHGPEMRHQDDIDAIAFSADSSLIVTGSDDNSARVWDSRTGAPHSMALPMPGSVTVVAFSPDARWVAGGSDNRYLRIWNLADGQPLARFQKLDGDITALAFSPDSRTLLTAGGGAARIWDVKQAMTLQYSFSPGARTYSGLFSPNGGLILTASDDQTARLWDAAGESRGRLHGGPIRMSANAAAVLFSPDSKLLAASVWDNSVRAWDVTTGLQAGPPLLLSAAWTALTISPDGKRLITVSRDGTVLSCDLPTTLPSLKQMQRRSWVALGARLNNQGVMEAIPWDEWQHLRDELQRTEQKGR